MYYKIGSIELLLEEVSAIGIVHHSSMSKKCLDIYLKGGQKVGAIIEATDDERIWPNGERKGYADLCSSSFVERVENEVGNFKKEFEKLNKI